MQIRKNLILLFILTGIFSCLTLASQDFDKHHLHDGVAVYIKETVKSYHSISDERKEKLKEIAEYINSAKQLHDTASLIFICTHNSRRSHFSQIWAQTAAYYYGVGHVYCYSGGTEATACNSRTVSALQRAGFIISTQDTASSNPHYTVTYSASAPSIGAFSKKYDINTNPQQKFAAIMTCSQADQACPLVFGADQRISVPYEDPKASDTTPQEKSVYDERCKQIATEMFFVFECVKKLDRQSRD